MKINRFYDDDLAFNLVYEGYLNSYMTKKVDAIESIEEKEELIDDRKDVIKCV